MTSSLLQNLSDNVDFGIQLKLISFEFLDEAIWCTVKLLENQSILHVSLDDLFYKNGRLRRFSEMDIRKLALLAANQLLLKEKLHKNDQKYHDEGQS